MGGLAGAAGEGGLNEPLWLVGGEVELTVAADRPTVWLCDIDDPSVRRRADRVSLLAGEAEAVAGRHDAAERLLRRRLARLLLATADGCRVDEVILARTTAGAPIVTTPLGWHVGLAARWPWCAIGIASRPVGVDVERVTGPLPDDLLTPAERLMISDANAAARRWAAKEAHAKWTGHPRDLDPAAIETGFPPAVTSRFGTTRCWLYATHDHVAAICTG